MLLQDKVAVIYGAGGAIGGAVARAFAAEGAKVFVTGRLQAPVEVVAKDIAASGSATDEEIRSAWPAARLPDELVQAWSVSRESRLFEDVEYGQWGLALLSPAVSAERTAEERARRPSTYRTDDVVIGEFLGDLELLVMAPSETGDRKILVALPLDDRHDWYPAASSLAQFLDKYLASHGAKYWESST